ncbi:MAG: putative membrane protein [Neolewinella sp.]
MIGILISNLRVWGVDNELMEKVAGASMLLGLPLLLFAVRIKDSLKYAKTMLLGFGLCCGAGLFCTAIVGYLMTGELTDSWKVAGMLVGLYTGGTPNVQAIGLALDAPTEYIALVQAADVLLGGAYLLGLVTFLPKVYAWVFPVAEADREEEDVEEAGKSLIPFKVQLPQLGAGIAVTAISVGLTYLFTGGLDNLTIMILLLTTVSLVASSINFVRDLGNTYPLGEYFILVFCVALGLMADFRALAADGMELLYFSALALISTTLLHIILCKLFKLDRDTVILSYVAGFYGPVFVVQVAAALKNQRLLAAGISVSLLGFGIGNYLGIGLANFVFWMTGG